MKDQWGGGILESRKNPKGLQRFNKNKKQKRILIGSIIGIVLIVGGISLYRSFALYKEEKTFDVLQGTVPDFVYKESILNGAYPVLKSSTGAKLIPVTIDENDGTVRKADIKDEWYKYEEKKWANAVILVDGVTEPKNDEVIPEENIESYFVWIPKYRYKIFDMGKYDSVQAEGTELENKAKPIEIEFGLVDTKDNVDEECATPNASGEDGTCEVDDWMTHPAFTAFENSKGFWVGKFETGYNQDTTNSNTINVTESWTKSGAEQNQKDISKVIIKPNVYSWRYISVGNIFNTSYLYQRELDSHMMKNTEWGAVAYLSHSKYGTCENDKCTEIRINNSSSFVTGVAAITSPESGYTVYKDYADTTPNTPNEKSTVYPKSKEASTTGNNTGIFDMNGGTWENTMGYVSTGDLSNYGLIKDTDLIEANAKYFDKYILNSFNQFNKRILGDATSEMGPFVKKRYNIGTNDVSSWYEDKSWFPDSETPSFKRGGAYTDGTNSGIFTFSTVTGAAYNAISYRIVLTP